ncbi:MAG: DUF5106 domain-containing protein [Prevotellaceae bacterium]|jgi:hypothetical protein|nr:DUF5106 domain-containing protein [Prevotellaceae bacterium]
MNRSYLCRSVIFTAIAACCVAASCGGGGRGEQTRTPKPFVLPTVPSIIIDPQEQANYLARHYWDLFDFDDTVHISQPKVIEKAIVEYLGIMQHVMPKEAATSFQSTIDKSQANIQIFRFFQILFEKYLYDPNSPLRNEDLYIMVLEGVVGSHQLDELEKIQPRFQLELLNLNRPGTIAADFVYTLGAGKKENMHRIKSEFLILFFNNPGCASCGEIQQGFEESFVFKELFNSGRMKILAMYVDDDFVAWESYRNTFPAHWINGYDASLSIRNNRLYDLRAIPNIYLLDKDKRVILRDVNAPQLEEYLYYMLQE